ncbi:MAG: cyclic nucleotide-binding domain-containing protein [Terracidiphilus sp.]
MKLDPATFVADPELLQALEEHSTHIVCAENRVLFQQGDEPTGLYVLRSGSATLTMTAHDGETILQTTVLPGALLGLPGFIGNQPYSLTAEAHKRSEVGFVNREDFSQMMLTHPSLSLKILAILAAEVRAARTALSES